MTWQKSCRELRREVENPNFSEIGATGALEDSVATLLSIFRQEQATRAEERPRRVFLARFSFFFLAPPTAAQLRAGPAERRARR